MPFKPKKPCACHGCRELTASRYCETHGKKEAKRYNRYDRDPDSSKRYGRSWKRIRAVFFSANPLCALCKVEGRLTPAVLAHHKTRLTDGGTNDWSNLQALFGGDSWINILHSAHCFLAAAALNSAA